MLIEYVRKGTFNPNKKVTNKGRFVANRKKKGVIVAVVCDDNVVRIGWSLCHRKDEFTKRGMEIAINRAKSCKSIKTFPLSIKTQLKSFIKRAEKYYKDKIIEINPVHE